MWRLQAFPQCSFQVVTLVADGIDGAQRGDTISRAGKLE